MRASIFVLLTAAALAPHASAEDLTADPYAAGALQRGSSLSTSDLVFTSAETRQPASATLDACAFDPCKPCCVGFNISLTTWIYGTDTEMQIGDRTVESDNSVGDVIDNIEEILEKQEFSISGEIGLHYGRWRLAFDFFAEEYGEALPLREGGVEVEGSVSREIYMLKLEYRLKCCPGPCVCPGTPSRLAYDVFAGLRYVELDGEIGVGPARRARTEDWTDPIVGGRVTWDLRNRWLLSLEADIGGFGVGSDFTWRVQAQFAYQLTRWLSLGAGWKALAMDYDNESSSNRFTYDGTLSGPYLVLNLTF